MFVCTYIVIIEWTVHNRVESESRLFLFVFHSVSFSCKVNISIRYYSVYHNLNQYFKLIFFFSPANSRSRGKEGLLTCSFIIHILLPLRFSLFVSSVVWSCEGEEKMACFLSWYWFWQLNVFVTVGIKLDPWWCVWKSSCKE